MSLFTRGRRVLAGAALVACAVAPVRALAQVGAPAARPDEPVVVPEGAPGDTPLHRVDPSLRNRHAIRAVRLRPDEHITVDGKLDAPAWQRAPVYDDFIENEPHHDARPLYRTEVRVLFDEQALYVGVTSFDDHPEQITAPLVRQDKVIRTQDFVVLYLDAIGKRQSAQFFRVNASGSIGDGMHTAADDDEDFSPSSRSSAARGASARRSRWRATGNGAWRCRTTSPRA